MGEDDNNDDDDACGSDNDDGIVTDDDDGMVVVKVLMVTDLLFSLSPRGMTIVLHNDHFPRNDHFTCNDHFPRNNFVGKKWPNDYSVGLRVEESGFGILRPGHCAMLCGSMICEMIERPEEMPGR